MQGIKRKNYIPNPTSPRGGRRACLCPDNTYSIKCCDGDNWAQGIGVITGVEGNFLTKEDDDLIMQEDNNKIIV